MPESVVVNDRNLYDEYGVHVRRGIDGGWPGRTPWSWQTQRPVGGFGAVRTATRPTVEAARLTIPLTMSADDPRETASAVAGALSSRIFDQALGEAVSQLEAAQGKPSTVTR